MNIYAMSDIHGCLQSFDEALNLIDLSKDNKLILCGDYIHGGQDNYGVLDRIMELERKYGSDKVIVLAGNHEDMACDGRWPIGEDRFFGSGVDNDDNDDKYISWMQNLRRYHVEGDTIFVHAEWTRRRMTCGNGERMILPLRRNILRRPEDST